jgi:hypothetical protein
MDVMLGGGYQSSRLGPHIVIDGSSFYVGVSHLSSTFCYGWLSMDIPNPLEGTCRQDVETNHHLFLECKFTMEVWIEIHRNIGASRGVGWSHY